ncbi:hypothetical protein BpHYR1_039207 [Brachionus plicatilis]|uniref:Uncharacterized protein n=1 Tax=Brachionus plicatilis TaxID=10195 RepID=A0A3M7QWF3_BRAPC|nr:hypothetical protein BpHYR1_039207 [Brachionus plicatilis]
MVINYSKLNFSISILKIKPDGNGIELHDIEPRANSLGMVLYNLWVHIAQAITNFHLANDKQNVFSSKTSESPYNFSFNQQIFFDGFERSCPLIYQIKIDFCAIFYSTPFSRPQDLAYFSNQQKGLKCIDAVVKF